jgi:hypothetical protein
MKALIKYLAVALFGLAVAAQSASAGAYNLSISVPIWPSSIWSAVDGGDPTIPAGANVSWWAYSYGASSARVELGGPVYGTYYAPVNGSTGGNTNAPSGGQLSIRLYCQADQNVGGSAAGCGVSVNW